MRPYRSQTLPAGRRNVFGLRLNHRHMRAQRDAVVEID